MHGVHAGCVTEGQGRRQDRRQHVPRRVDRGGRRPLHCLRCRHRCRRSARLGRLLSLRRCRQQCRAPLLLSPARTVMTGCRMRRRPHRRTGCRGIVARRVSACDSPRRDGGRRTNAQECRQCPNVSDRYRQAAFIRRGFDHRHVFLIPEIPYRKPAYRLFPSLPECSEDFALSRTESTRGGLSSASAGGVEQCDSGLMAGL